ncbi:uncharacterized protein H6S33_001085 [Morchella sextelata]|uniref:uncharacterized protein n=1 Tax=Morchella sextelata TaxID=1174677 RepID=UPI001D04F502|nr:uncharacterized protein H6S33_001085 [Morchella sextelata]KAH0608857.1 hypothetical protein H6S33_001085 [Morchella sextelata]
METAKPKLSILRRVLYGICGICGPKVEVSAVDNYYQPASRPSTSQSGKKRRKRPANVSVQGQGVSPSLQSPRSADTQSPPMGQYYQNIPPVMLAPDSGWSGSDHHAGTSENGQNGFSSAPPNVSGGYEIQNPAYYNIPVDNHFGEIENPPYEIIDHLWNNHTPANNVKYLGNRSLKTTDQYFAFLRPWMAV